VGRTAPAPAEPVNKSERTELRGIIRRRMKVLRADIEARRRELYLDIDSQLEREYEADLKKWDDLQFIIGEAIDEANRKINDLYREHYGRETWGEKHDKEMIGARTPDGPKRERQVEKMQRRAQVNSTVASAFVELDRREADLLEELATGALESAEARDFLARIPKVSELVPASRLEELTANVTDEDDAR
jgi:hypothetical protein